MTDKSDTTTEDKILKALRTYTNRSSYQIAEMTDLISCVLYPALQQLEQSGQIESFWNDIEPPRRRRYMVKEQVQ